MGAEKTNNALQVIERVDALASDIRKIIFVMQEIEKELYIIQKEIYKIQEGKS